MRPSTPDSTRTAQCRGQGRALQARGIHPAVGTIRNRPAVVLGVKPDLTRTDLDSARRSSAKSCVRELCTRVDSATVPETVPESRQGRALHSHVGSSNYVKREGAALPRQGHSGLLIRWSRVRAPPGSPNHLKETTYNAGRQSGAPHTDQKMAHKSLILH